MSGRPRSKTTATSKYERRKLEVLRAAARTFNRLGFHIATLDDVAQELGVTKPALYYYAKSKDELLFACGQLAIDALEDALRESAELELDAVERLRRFFRLYAEIICGDFGRCLALTEVRDLSPKSRRSSLNSRRSINLRISELVAEGRREGLIKPLDERFVTMALFDAFNGLARWFDRRKGRTLQEIVEQHLAVFLEGIREATPQHP